MGSDLTDTPAAEAHPGAAVPPTLAPWKRYTHKLIAAEISSFTRYYDCVMQWGRVPGDTGYLLEAIDCPEKMSVPDGEMLPDISGQDEKRTAVLLNGTLNYNDDIEALLAGIRPRLSRTSRIVVVAYNAYFEWLYRLAVWAGLKSGGMATTFITFTDLDNLCRLAGYERVRVRPAVYVPWRLLGLGALINWVMPAVPLLRHLAVSAIVVLRPLLRNEGPKSSLSVVIPARNERGNIAAAVQRIVDLGRDVEIIFVEGHSTDGTWEEIERVAAEYRGPHRITAYRQSGKGKADAVRLGFTKAGGHLLTILDADLTMPPEMLPRFLQAWDAGLADFVNGSRIVYAMEGQAMRFLNRLGNVFFAKLLTWVLGVRLGDSLCGTKLVTRHDYRRMQAWRRDFGDFDPFGDFELLFPAAALAIGMIDVPIRYRARTYGATSIHRFSHGLQLLKMTFIGFFRLKFARLP